MCEAGVTCVACPPQDGAEVCGSRHQTWRQNTQTEDEDGSQTSQVGIR